MQLLFLVCAFSGVRYTHALPARYAAQAAWAVQAQQLTEEEMSNFLRQATVVRDKSASIGITGVRRLSHHAILPVYLQF